MTDMEIHFRIPMVKTADWEKKNKAVVALYRKISMSRNFD
jgi:hypothetical protein